MRYIKEMRAWGIAIAKYLCYIVFYGSIVLFSYLAWDRILQNVAEVIYR